MSRLSAKKRRQILDAATQVFSDHGYGGASMGEIAKVSGVSKGTLYNHFDSKEDLFVAFAFELLEGYAKDLLEIPLESDHVEVLRSVGVAYFELLYSEEATRIYRAAVAEAQRFPEVLKAFYERGPGRAAERLGTFLAVTAQHGDVSLGDFTPYEAADLFLNICRGDAFLERFKGAPRPSPQDIDRTVRRFVAFFLAGLDPDNVGR